MCFFLSYQTRPDLGCVGTIALPQVTQSDLLLVKIGVLDIEPPLAAITASTFTKESAT